MDLRVEEIGKRVGGIYARTDIAEEDNKGLRWSVNNVNVQHEKEYHHLVSLPSRSSRTAENMSKYTFIGLNQCPFLSEYFGTDLARC